MSASKVFRATIATAGRLLSHRDAPLVILGLFALGLGAWLRAYQLGAPPNLGLDEHEFVNNANRLLRGEPDNNDHPPLGKLLIAIPIGLLGTNAVTRQLAQLVMGALAVVFAFELGQRLFRGWRAGLCAASLIAIEGPFIAYSRAALLDGMLVTLMLAALMLATMPRAVGWVLGGLFAGLAAAVKLSGVLVALPVALAVAYRARGWKALLGWGTASAVACLFAYWAVGAIAGSLGNMENPWLAAWTDTLSDLNRHLRANTRHHPMASPWYSWFLPRTHVSLVMLTSASGTAQLRTMMGNPLLWWSAQLAVLVAVAATVRAGWQRRRESVSKMLSNSAAQTYGLLFVAWLIPLVPWTISDRDSYVYHYMPCHTFALITLGGLLGSAYRRHRAVVLGFLACAVALSAFYAPVWTGRPLSLQEIDWRMFLWR